MAQDPEGADAGGADAAPGGAARKARKANPLANRIKRLMQTDEDVGKIAQASPALIGRRCGMRCVHSRTCTWRQRLKPPAWHDSDTRVCLQAGRWSCSWADCAEARTA
jgi:Histone-like transcription factor (CBF/NF-Y) and archaeal histone